MWNPPWVPHLPGQGLRPLDPPLGPRSVVARGHCQRLNTALPSPRPRVTPAPNVKAARRWRARSCQRLNTALPSPRPGFGLRRAVGPARKVGQTGCMDISIDAPTRTGEHFSFTNFVLSHKGDLTLAFSAFVYLVSLAALMLTHWRTSSEIAVSMAEAALIGGLCDYIALKMIFERRWYLPNSGVLPRNRAKLIDGIAATIENEWLTLMV